MPTGGWSRRQPKSGEVVRRHRPDYKIALYTAILMLLGLVVMYALGPQRAHVMNAAMGSNYSDSYFFIKQVAHIVLAAGAFVFVAFVPVKIYYKLATPLLIAALAACTVLLFAGWLDLPFAPEINGARSWFSLGALGSFQPSELLKLALVVYLGVFLGIRVKQGLINDFDKTILPLAVILGLVVFFVVLAQRDLGTGMATLMMVAAMLFMAGLSKRWFAIFGAVVLVGGLVMTLAYPHRMSRLTTFLKGDETSVSDDSTYHIENAKIAIGTGGLFGVGIGNSVQATGYLPEVINDSIFAVMGEVFGFVGLVALIAIFVAMLLRILRTAEFLVDYRLKLMAAGVFGWFGSHVILNIAAIIGLMPLTGITLPLVSYGGTSMLFMAAALGLVFQLSRYTIHPSHTKEIAKYENSSSRRRVGRARHSSSRRSS